MEMIASPTPQLDALAQDSSGTPRMPSPPLTPPSPQQQGVPQIETVGATPPVVEQEFTSSAESSGSATRGSNAADASPLSPDRKRRSTPQPQSPTRKSSLVQDSRLMSGGHAPSSPPVSPSSHHTQLPASPSSAQGHFQLSPPIVAKGERRTSNASANSSVSTFRIKRKPAPSEDGVSLASPERKHSVTSLQADSTLDQRRNSTSSSFGGSQDRRPSLASMTSMPSSPQRQPPSPGAQAATLPRQRSQTSLSNHPPHATTGGSSPGRSFQSLPPAAAAAPTSTGTADLTSKSTATSVDTAIVRTRSRVHSTNARPATATSAGFSTDGTFTPTQRSVSRSKRTPLPSRPATAPADGAEINRLAAARKDTVMVDGQAFVFGGGEGAAAPAPRSQSPTTLTAPPATPSRAVVGGVVDLSSLTEKKARDEAAALSTQQSRSTDSEARSAIGAKAPPGASINPRQDLDPGSIDTTYTYPRRNRSTPFKRPAGRAGSTDGIAARKRFDPALLPHRPGTASGSSSTLPFRRVPFKRQSITTVAADLSSSIDDTQRLTPPSPTAAPQQPVGSYAIMPPTQSALEEAASLSVFNETGDLVRFGDIFRARRTLVCFLRHWFCPMCQEFAHSMQKIDPLPLQRANIGLVVVGQGHPHVISAYKKVTGVPEWIRMYADPTRKIYKALGMTMKTNDPGPACAKPDYVQMSMLKGSLKAIRNGLFEMPLRTPGDLKLLGGEFIFGPGIQCSFTHRMVTTRGHLDLPRVLTQAGCDMTLQSARAIGEESGQSDEARFNNRVQDRRSLGRTVKQIARHFEADRQRSSFSGRPGSRAGSTIRAYSQDIPAVPKLPAAAAFESSRILAKSVSQPQSLARRGTQTRMQPREAKAQAGTEANLVPDDADDEDQPVTRRDGNQLSLSDAILMGPPDQHKADRARQAKQRQTLADGPSSSSPRISAEPGPFRKHSEDGSSLRKGSSPLLAGSSAANGRFPTSRKKGLLDVSFQNIRKSSSTPDLAQSQTPRSSTSSRDIRSVFRGTAESSVVVKKSEGESSQRATPELYVADGPKEEIASLETAQKDLAKAAPAANSQNALAPASASVSVANAEQDSGLQPQTTAVGRNSLNSGPSANSTPKVSTSSPLLDDVVKVPLPPARPSIESQGTEIGRSASLRSQADGGGEGADLPNGNSSAAIDDAIESGRRSAAEFHRDSLNKSLPSLPNSRDSPDQYGSLDTTPSASGGSFLDDLDVLDGFRHRPAGAKSLATVSENPRADSVDGGSDYPRESFETWDETEAADSDSDMEHGPGWARRPRSVRQDTPASRMTQRDSFGVRPSMDSVYSRMSMQSDDYRDSASYHRPSYDGTERSYSDDDEERRGEYSEDDDEDDYDRRDTFEERRRRASEDDSRSDYTASPEDRDPSRDVYKSNNHIDVASQSGISRNAYNAPTRITNGYLLPRTLDTFAEEEEEAEQANGTDDVDDEDNTTESAGYATVTQGYSVPLATASSVVG